MSLDIEDNISYYIKLRCIPYIIFYMLLIYPIPFLFYFMDESLTADDITLFSQIILIGYWIILFMVPMYFMAVCYGRTFEMDVMGNINIYSGTIEKKKSILTYEYDNIKYIKIYYKYQKVSKIAIIPYIGRSFVVYRKNSSNINHITKIIVENIPGKAYYVN